MGEPVIKLTINGRAIEAWPGETILEAALRYGIMIPTFCWHPKLDPVGACRMCLVEVEKQPKLAVSCATFVAEGMVVYTNSPKVIKGRQGVLEFLLINHPLDCPTCDKGGECDLQDLTFAYGLDLSRFLEHKFRFLESAAGTFDELSLGPMVVRNQNRCIHCYKCTRIIQEYCGEHDLGAYHRGYRTEIHHWPAKAFDDQYAGNAVEVCPVGALTAKDFRYKVRVWLTRQIPSVCSHCSDGCNLMQWVDPARNLLTRMTSRRNDFVDDGIICHRGKFQYQEANHPDRLKSPLIRKQGHLVEVAWDEVLETLANRLTELRQRYGGEVFAGVSNPRASIEDHYIFQRFFRATLGSNNIDFRTGYGDNPPEPEIFAHFNRFSVEGLEQKKLIFIFGCDFNREHPILALRIRKAKRKFGTRVVVCNSYRTKLGDIAEVEAVYRFGSEIWFLNSLCQEIIRQKLATQTGYSDSEGIPEDFLLESQKYDARQAELQTGVSPEVLTQVAKNLGGIKELIIFGGTSVLRHPQRGEFVSALGNLAALLVGPAQAASVLNILAEEANFQGAIDAGMLPDRLPGNIGLLNSERNSKFESLWKKSIPRKPGLNLAQILDATQKGQIKVWYVLNEEPTWSYPDRLKMAEALGKIELLVVHAQFRTPIVERADFVLPSAMIFERDGAYTNAEKRIQRFKAGLRPPGEARADWQILCQLAECMDEPFNLFSAEEVFDEFAQAVPNYAKLTFTSLGDQGQRYQALQPPENFVVKFKKIVPQSTGLPPAEYPFLCLAANSLYQSGFICVRTENLLRQEPESLVEMHPKVLEDLGCQQNERLELTSTLDKIRVAICENARLPYHIVILHNNFPEARYNLLHNHSSYACWVKIKRAPIPTAFEPEKELVGV